MCERERERETDVERAALCQYVLVFDVRTEGLWDSYRRTTGARGEKGFFQRVFGARHLELGRFSRNNQRVEGRVEERGGEGSLSCSQTPPPHSLTLSLSPSPSPSLGVSAFLCLHYLLKFHSITPSDRP